MTEINPDDVKPQISDIAALERTRTRSDDGEEFDTFNESTSPKASEVNELIESATSEVLGQIPDEIDPEQYPEITRVIALRAAILIEQSYFRNQAGEGSPLAAMIASYLSGVEALRAQPLRLP